MYALRPFRCRPASSARLAADVGKIHAVRTRRQPWQDSPAVIQLDKRLRAYRLA